MTAPSAAVAYAGRHDLHALVIQRGGEVVVERYGGGYDAAMPHAIYSGTKSFWGVAAVAAQDDGILLLDESVGETFDAWRTDPRKRHVTLRMLLNLTSGLAFGGLGAGVPAFEAALAKDIRDEPGSTFTYGGIPLQVFGAVLARKLGARGETPQAYLRERILQPAGVPIAAWRSLRDGSLPLPTGVSLTAHSWLAYGDFILNNAKVHGTYIVDPANLAACFEGSHANPRYGLGWWLDPVPGVPGIKYASGSGGQALYVVPSLQTVVVHFSKSNSWRHETFLKRLIDGD